MPRWLVVAWTLACTAPEVRAIAVDSGTAVADVAVESAVDAHEDTYRLNPEATCSGHDEDRDGFPDRCDTCPSIANPGQAAEAETQPKYVSVGRDCYPGAGFESATKRVLFDPFTELSPSWTGSFGLGAFAIATRDAPDVLRGGEVADVFHYVLWNKPLLVTRTVVATAVIAISRSEGASSAAGIMVRAGGTPLRFLACHHDGGSFFLSVSTKRAARAASARSSGSVRSNRIPGQSISRSTRLVSASRSHRRRAKRRSSAACSIPRIHRARSRRRAATSPLRPW
jgi:hypothetical protein